MKDLLQFVSAHPILTVVLVIVIFGGLESVISAARGEIDD